MKKAGWIAVAVATPLLILAAVAAAALPPLFRSSAALLQMTAAFDRDDCDSVLRIGLPLVAGRDLSALPGGRQAFAFEIVAQCEVEKGRMAQAYAHARRATGFEDSSDWVWRYRVWLELDGKKYRAAVGTIEKMSESRATALDSMQMNWLWTLDGALRNGGQDALRRRLLAVLADDSYDPDETFVPPDDFRFSYAGLLIDTGERDRARSIIMRLSDPSVLARASLDPRFRAFFPNDPDIRAAAEAQLAVHRAAMAGHPDLLMPINAAARDLRLLGRPREALALLHSAEARIDDSDAFSDREDNVGWYWDIYAKIYQMLGRTDDMVRAYRKGATMDEGGSANVSQLLNLAYAQLDAGRHEDALKTLELAAAPERGKTPYGEMMLRFVRGCALARAGRAAEAAADVAFARVHEKEMPDGFAALLLCVGDVDGAATAYIRRLRDPEQSAEVLLGFSDFDDPPVATTPDPSGPRWEALQQRRDVKAAIARAGGTRRFRVQGSAL